jgi:hypothetical protein
MQILPIYFAISLFISLFILYILYPAPKIILKIPNVDRHISDLYIDEDNVCYKYFRKEVKCKNN